MFAVSSEFSFFAFFLSQRGGGRQRKRTLVAFSAASTVWGSLFFWNCMMVSFLQGGRNPTEGVKGEGGGGRCIRGGTYY